MELKECKQPFNLNDRLEKIINDLIKAESKKEAVKLRNNLALARGIEMI